ncbi:hypothetical protein FKM82_008190 [Ascaphus truei]
MFSVSENTKSSKIRTYQAFNPKHSVCVLFVSLLLEIFARFDSLLTHQKLILLFKGKARIDMPANLTVLKIISEDYQESPCCISLSPLRITAAVTSSDFNRIRHLVIFTRY